jgi:hypothetical protein
MTEKQTWTVSGKDLVDRVKQAAHEGNIRRLRIIHKGRPLVDIPLSVGATAAAVGVLAAPVLAAVAAIAALVSEVTIEVEKISPDEMGKPDDKAKM